MSQSLEVSGVIVEIYPIDNKNEKYPKREFVIMTTEEYNGKSYYKYTKFQLSKKLHQTIEGYPIGQTVSVTFNLSGIKWEKDGKVNYATILEVWKISSVAGANQPQPVRNEGIPVYSASHTTNGGSGYATNQQSPETIDDLPF